MCPAPLATLCLQASHAGPQRRASCPARPRTGPSPAGQLNVSGTGGSSWRRPRQRAPAAGIPARLGAGGVQRGAIRRGLRAALKTKEKFRAAFAQQFFILN